MYDDTDGTRKDEIAALGGAGGAGQTVFTNFYDRLKEVCLSGLVKRSKRSIVCDRGHIAMPMLALVKEGLPCIILVSLVVALLSSFRLLKTRTPASFPLPIMVGANFYSMQIRDYHRKHPGARAMEPIESAEELIKEEPQVQFSGEVNKQVRSQLSMVVLP